EAAVVAVPRARRGRVLAALRRAAPVAPVVVVADEDDPTPGDVTLLSPAALAELVVEPVLARALTRARVERVRAHFERAERVLIMIQDDPDPDAIASALALKIVLGRTRGGATIGTFGTVGRPENRAMTRILDIDVERLTVSSVRESDRVAMVAFAFLHGLANHGALRRIERPELPPAVLDLLAEAITRRRLVDGVMFTHVGPMPYRELAAQFADLLLQVEGAEWTVVSGEIEGELHISVRNSAPERAA